MDAIVSEEKKIKQQIGNIIDENRVLSFSDAVFAFAATLLVLKIDLPDLVKSDIDSHFLVAIHDLWPVYAANITSFLIICYYWLNHHAIFGLLKRFDGAIVWLNIIFLIFLSFLPFPVDLYGDFTLSPVVVVFFSASVAVVGYLLALLWWYASHNYRLIDKELGSRQVRYYLARNLLGPVIFTLSIPLVYIHPLLAQLSWILIILGVVVLNKIFKVKRVSKIDKELV